MTATASAPSKGPSSRRGSSFSDRQIAQAVKDERMVVVLDCIDPVTDKPLTGFIYGADDFHWGLVTDLCETFLIHKSTTALSITSVRLTDLSVDPEDVRQITQPYQRTILRTHFNQTDN